MVKELEVNKIKISNLEFEDIEEKASHSLMVETHLKIYEKIIQQCISHKDSSEQEISIIKSGGSVNCDSIEQLLLLFLSNNLDWDENARKYPKFRQSLIKFQELYKPKNFQYKPSFNSLLDPKLSYESPLKKLIRHAYQDKLKTDSFKSITENVNSPDQIIIYIEGGVTMTEYRDAMAISESLGINTFLVSDKIITRESVIRSL